MNKSLEDSRSSRVQVVVRVRPQFKHESGEDVAITCAPDGSKVQVILPERLAEKQRLPGATKNGARSYEFDACLSGNVSQEDLWDVCGLQELVEAALDGYCVTIFAYGQTGSGKTYTMIGPHLSRQIERLKNPSQPSTSSSSSSADPNPPPPSTDAAPPFHVGLDSDDGLLSRCVYNAFEGIAARSDRHEFSVTESCLEIYNENVTDLLANGKEKSLQVKLDARGGFQVENLTQLACQGPLSTLKQLQKALFRRHTRAHRLNEYSSRSHCLITFVFASRER
eukprot:CAMPEP_0175047166 /NCGR_PEP_ID=MMETSP0052_2-20121109/5438_1 /TAXON_ID=51329 ORGANISM="Polytomella parva, Strain SAG 63-3" /NCGR_SAMPLE_ID=MMETSP0052_2 /ASSEMBLY_ACC=CAM_ASM_000194 /LENGTH=280 /DNA_ID=CAMNT_0016310999 /DNA_START=94 /DNA_END=933 /DNA_ORIENTATION=+